MLLYFAFKYKRRSETERPPKLKEHKSVEMIWIIVPFILSMVMFYWGAVLFFDAYRMPKDALEVFVVGKQWMWKIQHPNGKREINHLHVPVGKPVKLLITSEDVIHSFYVPAFRIKQDAVPGRYTATWFEATKPGDYHLFCAEYCGTEHSRMIGWVTVMKQEEYQLWLSGGSTAPVSLAAQGKKLFYEKFRCNTCHAGTSSDLGPSLEGLFGHAVDLNGGQTVTADEAYIRESILNPSAKVVANFLPVMPTFKGQITEEQMIQLIAYIKSLGES
jgi:cytochrome c oxidase subunit II